MHMSAISAAVFKFSRFFIATDVQLDFREPTDPISGCDIQEQRFISKLTTNTFVQSLTISQHVGRIKLIKSFNGVRNHL